VINLPLMAVLFKSSRRNPATPRLAEGEEADLSVKSAQGEVLVPVAMVDAIRELQRATLGRSTEEAEANTEGFVAINDAPRHPSRVKTVTVRY
jgi:hypothetical protein